MAAPLTREGRTTITYLYDLGGDFAGSYVNYYNRQAYSGAVGDTLSDFWALKTLGYAHYANGSDEIDVSLSLSFLPFNLQVEGELVSGDFGEYDWGYDTPVGSNFGESFITKGVDMGRHALFFNGGGFGGTGIGKTFVSTVRLAGDWSDPANRSALKYNPAWTITEDFVYDGVGATIISGFIDSYDGSDPLYEFTLYGDSVGAVPEPGSVVLIGAGLALLALRFRKTAS
jgi:hypothetical protein